MQRNAVNANIPTTLWSHCRRIYPQQQAETGLGRKELADPVDRHFLVSTLPTVLRLLFSPVYQERASTRPLTCSAGDHTPPVLAAVLDIRGKVAE